MPRRRVTELVTFLIASCILAGFGWAMSRNSMNTSPTDQVVDTARVPDPNVQSKPEKEVDAGSIIILKKIGNSHSIVSKSLTTKESKILYTDSDEEMKIIKALFVRSNEIIIIESAQPLSDSGSLTGISLDGRAQKHVYQKDISASIPPILNPQNEKIIMINFSPVEKSFGFSLVGENIDGTNQSIILQNVQSILAPTYSPRGDKVLYASTQSNKTSLSIIDTSSGSVLKQSDIEGVVLDSAWIQNTLYISLAPKGNATSNNASLKTFSEQLEPIDSYIPDLIGAELNVVSISPTIIGFVRVEYPHGVPSAQADGTVILYDTISHESTEFDQAQKIIGYIHG